VRIKEVYDLNNCDYREKIKQLMNAMKREKHSLLTSAVCLTIKSGSILI